MGYAGRNNIYEATIRRMVAKALEEQEEAFRLEHESDTLVQLARYLHGSARELGHSPWPGEILGGTVIDQRFGSWEKALIAAGLPKPCTVNKSDSFARVQQETRKQKERYRQRKAEKKILAEKRRAEQNGKRKNREQKQTREECPSDTVIKPSDCPLDG